MPKSCTIKGTVHQPCGDAHYGVGGVRNTLRCLAAGPYKAVASLARWLWAFRETWQHREVRSEGEPLGASAADTKGDTERAGSPTSPVRPREEIEAVLAEADPKLVKKFYEYHRANPHIFDDFKRLAGEMRKTGRSRYGAWVIVQRIRWDRDMASVGDVFRINNDYIALYARLLVYEDPSYVGFFEMRAMKPSGRRTSREENKRIWEKEREYGIGADNS
jgi:hypothetical protein